MRYPVSVHVAMALACAACTCAETRRPPSPGRDASTEAVSRSSWGKPVEVARGNARSGPWQMNDSDFDYVDDPSVAIASDGSLAVAWVDNARKDVFFRTFDATGRPKPSAPVNVSRSGDVFSWLPRVVLAGASVVVLWQEIVFSGGSHGGDIFVARSVDAGRTFAEPMNLSRSRGGDGKGRLSRDHWDNGSLDLAADSRGQVLASWTEYDGALWLSRSEDGGASFSTPIQVAGNGSQPARGPSLAMHRDHAYLVWATAEVASSVIRLAVSADGGRRFGPAADVALAGDGHADAPSLAVDEQGALHLVWGERVGARAPRIRYARRPFGGVAFDAPRVLSGAGGSGASFPSLALGAKGEVVVVWQHQPSAGVAPAGLGFVRSDDGGSSFSPPEVIPGTAAPDLGVNGSRQGKLMQLVAAHPSGAVAVVQSSYRDGHSSRVRLILGQ